jgi:hypothetical protein
MDMLSSGYFSQPCELSSQFPIPLFPHHCVLLPIIRKTEEEKQSIDTYRMLYVFEVVDGSTHSNPSNCPTPYSIKLGYLCMEEENNSFGL